MQVSLGCTLKRHDSTASPDTASAWLIELNNCSPAETTGPGEFACPLLGVLVLQEQRVFGRSLGRMVYSAIRECIESPLMLALDLDHCGWKTNQRKAPTIGPGSAKVID